VQANNFFSSLDSLSLQAGPVVCFEMSALKCRLCNLEMSKRDYYSGHKKICEDRFSVGATTVRSGRASSSGSSSSAEVAFRRESSVSFETSKQTNQASSAGGRPLFITSRPASQPDTNC
jgi:hypothetical protein